MSEAERAWRDYWERQPRTLFERSPTIAALMRQAFEAGAAWAIGDPIGTIDTPLTDEALHLCITATCHHWLPETGVRV